MQPLKEEPSVDIRGARSFNSRQATFLGVVLVVCGGLSILFNIIDLCIGTGLPADVAQSADFYSWSSVSSLSRVSLGVVVHGIWCGSVVSTFTHYCATDVFGDISAAYMVFINLFNSV